MDRETKRKKGRKIDSGRESVRERESERREIERVREEK